jgi:hypothetical protein
MVLPLLSASNSITLLLLCCAGSWSGESNFCVQCGQYQRRRQGRIRKRKREREEGELKLLLPAARKQRLPVIKKTLFALRTPPARERFFFLPF